MRIYRTFSTAILFLAVTLLLYQFQEKENRKPVLISEIKVERAGYDLLYDSMHKQPRWVYEHLTKEQLLKGMQQRRIDFLEDPQIPKHLRATSRDYYKSGFDRGHMSAAANAKDSKEAYEETFFLSNISPQNPDLNRGFWAHLEKHIRDLAIQHGSVHVFTGPIYQSHQGPDGKRWVSYEVIGNQEVAVPSHYFKIVLEENCSLVAAYLVPNQSIKDTLNFDEFQTSLKTIEKAAGIALKVP